MSWETVELGEICDLVGGGTPKKSRAEFYGGRIPWATVRDMNVDLMVSTEHAITPAGLEASSAKIVPAGTVVVAARVGLGKVAVLGQDTALNQDLRGLVIRDDGRVSPQYLYWWYRSVSPRVIEAGTGATVQGVTLPFLKSLLVPLPPIAEQRRVAGTLQDIFAGVDRIRTSSAGQELLSQRLRSSLVTALMQTEQNALSLGEVCEILDRFRKPLTKRDRKPGPIPYYGASGIIDYVDGYIFDEELVLLGEDGAKWGPGDASAFMVAGKAWVNNHAHVLRPDNGVIRPQWLVEYLNAADLAPWITGLTVPKLNQAKMRTIPVPLPSLAAQDEALARIESISAHLSSIQRIASEQSEGAELLAKQALSAAFSGEL
jgi:type I restriction enzyme S subunit